MNLKIFICSCIAVVMTALALSFTISLIISDIYNHALIYAWK